MLCASLIASARADDFNARAAQAKEQLQMKWLPAWAAKSPANESATEAAGLLETLSHAHRLGYSSPQLNLLDAARVHYRLLRDSRQDKTNSGFFAASGGNTPLKSAQLQANVVSALVEYARASGESEPRALAIKTWRLLRDRARDKINGGYYDSFLSGPIGPTQASGSGLKSFAAHLFLLEAGTDLFAFTHDRSIRRDVEELLDLNRGRFFPARSEEGFFAYTPDWKGLTVVDGGIDIWPSQFARAGAAIARTENTLGLPVQWVDFARRVEQVKQSQGTLYAPFTLNPLSILAQNVPASRERRATQIDEVLDIINAQKPDVFAGRALLDFVAAFDTSSPSQ